MRVSILVDDRVANRTLSAEHGLSIFFELNGKKYLFDTGSSDLFIQNASRLGINLVDTRALFLSHGHKDHTGGLRSFLRVNCSAKIYATPTTFRDYYALRPNGNYENIGTENLSSFLSANDRVIFTEDRLEINNRLLLFSNVSIEKYPSEANCYLFKRSVDGKYQQDDFLHEQNLFVKTEEGKKVLITGCSHCGIVNIIEKFIKIVGTPPDIAIGGFHLSVPSRGTSIPDQTIDKIAERLANWSTQYYTGHCTGTVAYERVQDKLKDQITLFGTGDQFVF